MSNKEALLAQWLAEEAAIRGKIAAVGVAGLDAQKQLTGLEFLRQIRDGKLPYKPICDTLNFIPIVLEEGFASFQGTPDARHFNAIGSVHGSYFCALLDSAAACAVHTTLGVGMGYTTLELKVNLIRGMNEKTGPVRAEGKIISAGRKVAVAEARIVDVEGKVYGHTTSTCLIFPLP